MRRLATILLLLLCVAPAFGQAPQKIYGPGLRADSLSNIPLNSRNITVSWTFTATRSEPLLGIRLTSPIRTGYTAGNGGNINIAIIGTPYAGFIFQNSTDPYAIATFAPGPPLVAGQVYTITVRNVADDAANNWRSVDGLVVNQVDPLDLPNSATLSGKPHPTNVPMWEVLYASTNDVSKSPTAQGVGYEDVANGAAVALPNVRECFTPSQTITVVSGAIALRGLVQSGTISLGGQTAILHPPAVSNGWSPFYFQNSLTLPAGKQQCLQPFGTATAVFLQKGWHRAADGVTTLYDFAPQTFFNDGKAQALVNGVWGDPLSELGSPDPRFDVMFYLVTQ